MDRPKWPPLGGGPSEPPHHPLATLEVFPPGFLGLGVLVSLMDVPPDPLGPLYGGFPDGGSPGSICWRSSRPLGPTDTPGGAPLLVISASLGTQDLKDHLVSHSCSLMLQPGPKCRRHE